MSGQREASAASSGEPYGLRNERNGMENRLRGGLAERPKVRSWGGELQAWIIWPS